MNKIFTKIKDFVGLNESDEYYDYEEETMAGEQYSPVYSEESTPLEERERPLRRRQRETSTITAEVNMETQSRSNVIGMPGIPNAMAEVVVIDPHSFEEMPQVIQTLRERRSVVLNLNAMEPEEAQRAVDFVAGGTYAIDGHQERIGESIFLFTPNCVKVSTRSGVNQEEVEQAPIPLHADAPAWMSEASRIAQ